MIFPISASLEQGMEGTTVNKAHYNCFRLQRMKSEDLNYYSLSYLHKYSKGEEETESQCKVQKNSKLNI